MTCPSSFYEFNSLDADVVLLAQCTQFRVHKCILAAASPFFRDMFTLPQQSPSTPSLPSSSSSYLANSELPTVPVSESPAVLDTLLRFVYPVPDPRVDSLSTLVPVLAASIKYDIEFVTATLRRHLVSPTYLESSPTRVFAIACRFDLDEEAKIASRYTLNVNLFDCPLSDDLKYITAYSYHRLLELHKNRSREAQKLLCVAGDVKCMQCNASSYGAMSAPRWWTEFAKRAKEELAVRPTTDVIFQMGFLASAASASGCQRCPGSVLDSYRFLEALKKRIDALPDTI